MTRIGYVESGIRHATINGHRFHLRLGDPDRMNPLWIDGKSPPLLLDRVAAETFALIINAMWLFQQGQGDESEAVRSFVVTALMRKYAQKRRLVFRRLTEATISANVNRIFGTIMAIAEGVCPIERGLPLSEMKMANWAAPARMDLAITYKCNLDCSHCYLPDSKKQMEELTFSDWQEILRSLWKIGVPQVVFTGGEPTIRKDLVDLVAVAKEFVTGLVTNGTHLVELAQPLRDASLDYAQVTLESSDPDVHNAMVNCAEGADAFSQTVDGIAKALEVGLHVTTNTTLTKKNAGDFLGLLAFGKSLGLKNMACNTLICSGRGKAAKQRDGLLLPETERLLEDASHKAYELGINLEWYSPTCYLELNPLALGFGAKSCSAAAYNMTIQPDGTVLPCQSWPESVGSILRDPWDQIWNHPTCQKLRNRQFLHRQCMGCAFVSACHGGCPLDSEKGGSQ